MIRTFAVISLIVARLFSADEPTVPVTLSISKTVEEPPGCVLTVKADPNYSYAVEWSRDMSAWAMVTIHPAGTAVDMTADVSDDRFGSKTNFFRIRYWHKDAVGTFVGPIFVYNTQDVKAAPTELPMQLEKVAAAAKGTVNTPKLTVRKKK